MQRGLYLIFAVVFCGLAALFLLRNESLTTSTAGAAFMAAGWYAALEAVRSRLVLDGTRMQVRGALRTREFDLNQVEGYRTFRNRSQEYRVICLRDGAGKIPLTKYRTDESLEQWLVGLKDLDAQNREQLLQKIDQDQELGTTPEQRRAALASAKQINIVLWVLDAAAAAAFVLAPAQYRLAAMAILALAPAAAAYMVYRRPLLYAVFKAKGDPRAEVSLVLTISGFGLFLGAGRVNFISVGLLFPFIALGALAFLAMFYPAAKKNPRLAATLMGLLFLSAFYGWGLAASADTAADHADPQTYTVQVLGGHVSRGRSTSYYLELEPWGPYAGVNTQMKVSETTYAATRPGQVVCLALHAGALHAPWYEIVACDNTAGQSANP